MLTDAKANVGSEKTPANLINCTYDVKVSLLNTLSTEYIQYSMLCSLNCSTVALAVDQALFTVHGSGSNLRHLTSKSNN